MPRDSQRANILTLPGVTADAAREKSAPVIIAKAVNLRGPARAVAQLAGDFLQHVGLGHPAAEGAFIQWLLKNQFVGPLQFRQGEFFGQQMDGDVGVLQL